MRVLRAVFSVSAVLLGSVALCVAVAIERTLPSEDASVSLVGLHGPVDIRFDRLGIPRIRAADDFDAAEALGFVHARDRMMQMDLMRRAASGDLSELIGPLTLEHDEAARMLGTRVAAEQSLASLSKRTRSLLDAYSRGVNAFIAKRGRFAAPEYLLLGAPRRWAPVDCVLWAETMGLALSGNLDLELGRLALSGRMSRDGILALWPTSTALPADQASIRGTASVGFAGRGDARRLAPFSPRHSRCPTTRPTSGRSMDGTPQAGRRCWLETRICLTACHPYGTWPGSTRRIAPWSARPRREHRSW